MAKLKVIITDKNISNILKDEQLSGIRVWQKTWNGFRDIFKVFIDEIAKDIYLEGHKMLSFKNILNFRGGSFEAEFLTQINEQYKQYILKDNSQKNINKYFEKLKMFFPGELFSSVIAAYKNNLETDNKNIESLMIEIWKKSKNTQLFPTEDELLNYDFKIHFKGGTDLFEQIRKLSFSYGFDTFLVLDIWKNFKESKMENEINSDKRIIEKFLTIINIISFVLSAKISENENTSLWIDKYIDLESMSIVSEKKDKDRIKIIPSPEWLEDLCIFGLRFIFSIYKGLSKDEKYKFLTPFNKMFEVKQNYSKYVDYYNKWPKELQVIFFDNLKHMKIVENKWSIDDDVEDIYKKTTVFDYSKFEDVHKSKLGGLTTIVTDWLLKSYKFYYEKSLDFSNFDPEIIHFWDDDVYTDDIRLFLDSKIGSGAKFPPSNTKNSNIQQKEINSGFINSVIDKIKTVIKNNLTKYSMDEVLTGIKDNNVQNPHLLYKVQEGVLEILKNEVIIHKTQENNQGKFHLKSNFNFKLKPTKEQYNKTLKYKDFNLNEYLKAPEQFLNEKESKKYLITKQVIDKYLDEVSNKSVRHKSLILNTISSLLRPFTQDRKMRIFFDNGLGGNGKTTFFHVISRFLGVNSIAFLNFLDVFGKKTADKYSKGLWIGKTGVFFDEIPENFNEVEIEKFRESLNQTNKTTVEKKYKDVVAREFSLTFVGNRNGRLKIKNQSFPTLDRFLLIPWIGRFKQRISLDQLLNKLFQYPEYTRMYLFKLIIEVEQNNILLEEQKLQPLGWELIEYHTLNLYKNNSRYNEFMFGTSIVKPEHFPFYARFWNINISNHLILGENNSFYSSEGNLNIIRSVFNFKKVNMVYRDFASYINLVEKTDINSPDFKYPLDLFKSKMNDVFGLHIVKYKDSDYFFDSQLLADFTVETMTDVYDFVDEKTWKKLTEYFKTKIFKEKSELEINKIKKAFSNFENFTLEEYLKIVLPSNKKTQKQNTPNLLEEKQSKLPTDEVIDNILDDIFEEEI